MSTLQEDLLALASKQGTAFNTAVVALLGRVIASVQDGSLLPTLTNQSTLLDVSEDGYITDKGKLPVRTTAPVTPVVTPVVSAPIVPTLRVKANGGPVQAAEGAFIQDAYFSGGSLFSINEPIANTTEQKLFQSERYGESFSYNLPVTANQKYQLTLYFAELFWTARGQRVFDVTVNGTKVLSAYDIFAEVGAKTATTKTFTIVPTSNTLTVSFTKVVDCAKVAALKLTPVS